ncbi:MAG: hypothetical protein ACI4JM_12895 [Oscillospiraceae bacterium]
MNLDFNNLKGMLDNEDTKNTLNGILNNSAVSELLENLGQSNLDADSIKEMIGNAGSENISKILSNFKPEDIQNLASKLGNADSSVADGLKDIIGSFTGGNK